MDSQRKCEVNKGPLVSAPRGPLLTPDLEKFQSLYKSEFGIELSKEDAYEKGIKLLSLMSLVYKPMSKNEYSSIQKHRRESISLLAQRLNESEE
jgi:hypothetical protein